MQFIETKKTLKLAYPIIFGELAQMALQLIDTVMVGEVSYKHLAAAALVISVINIPFILGIGITISVSQLVSMSNGRRDGAKVSHYLFNGFVLSALVAIIISIGLELSKGILYHLGQDPKVADLAVPYMQLMGWSVIPMLLFMVLKQFTDGLEFTKTAMILSISAIPLNAFLNWLFIFGNWGFPRLELTGAGWGTFITRTIIFIILLVVVLKHSLFQRYIKVAKTQWKISWRAWKELLHIGVPTSLQLGMESGAFAISGILIGTIGAREQAAHQIALTIASFTFMASIGLSQAGSIRVSNALGRGELSLVRRIGKSTIITAICYGTICAVLFIFLRNLLPKGFTEDTQVIHIAAYLLLFAAIFQISDSTQAISAGLLRGIKDVKIPTIYIIIAYWVVGLPIGSWLAFSYNMGAAGIWIGFILGLTVSAVLLSLRFLKKTKKIIHH